MYVYIYIYIYIYVSMHIHTYMCDSAQARAQGDKGVGLRTQELLTGRAAFEMLRPHNLYVFVYIYIYIYCICIYIYIYIIHICTYIYIYIYVTSPSHQTSRNSLLHGRCKSRNPVLQSPPCRHTKWLLVSVC